MDQETTLLVAFAKLEGKVDLTLTELGALKAADSDHEQRLRSIESLPIPDASTEQRLRVLEDRRTISPAQLWAGLVGVAGVLASVATVLAVLRP
jgi:hypothetical protein